MLQIKINSNDVGFKKCSLNNSSSSTGGTGSVTNRAQTTSTDTSSSVT